MTSTRALQFSLIPAALLLAVGLAGCTAPANQVTLVDSAFQPSELTVAHGVAVHFVNHGSLRHTVTIHDGAGDVLFDHALDPGATVDFTFPAAGDYHVFCRNHAAMGMELPVTAT